jgi:hypothetical protein
MVERVLQLETQTQKYLFQYSPGCEHEVIDQISELAEDPACELAWVDAAHLSYQIAQYAADECTMTLTQQQADGIE